MPSSPLQLPPDCQTFLRKFTIRLRFYREACNLSQAEVASQLKIGLRSYQRYETGESSPPLCLLFQLAHILRVNPEDLIAERVPAHDEWVRFYEGPDKKLFEEDPLVKTSKLLTIYQSEEFEKVLTHNDLSYLRENSIFKSSSYPLYLANIKYCLVNPTAKKKNGHKSDLIVANFPEDQAKRQGELWAYLLEKKMCYVQTTHYCEKPSGYVKVTCQNIFVTHNNSIFALGICNSGS